MYELHNNETGRDRVRQCTRLLLLAVIVAVLAILAEPVFAAEDTQKTLSDLSYYNKLFGTLIGALVVATILESALAVIFNWRVYMIVLNGRAWKTVFMVVGAWIIVAQFDYDIVGKILAQVEPGTPVVQTAAEAPPAAAAVPGQQPAPAPAVAAAAAPEEPDNFGSALLSVLFLAGGSAGVHNLLRQFGYRSPLQELPEERLDETEAWISVNVVRKNAAGPVEVHIEEIKPDPDKVYPPLATVLDDTHVLKRAWQTMWARPMRYPPYGGRTVRTNKYYRIRVTGNGIADKDQTVFEGRFASRAVVDFIKTV